jgi:hypothetical protein
MDRMISAFAVFLHRHGRFSLREERSCARRADYFD